MLTSRYLIIILIIISILFEILKAEDGDLKVQTLSEMRKEKLIIMLTQNEFNNLIKPVSRRFSAIVLFTALDSKRECSTCADAHREIEHIAKLWKMSDNYSNDLYFVNIDVDYGDGIEIFKSLGLKHAPIILHFAANTTKKNFEIFDPKKYGIDPEILAKWIHRTSGIEIKIVEIVDYRILIAKIVAIFLVVSFLFLNRNNLINIILSRVLWSIASIALILAFISGQVWNNIRSPPFYRHNPKTGGKMYVAPINNFQFIAETYGVAFLYSIIVIGFIIINQGVKLSNTIFKICLMIIGIMIDFFFFCVLLFIFETKTKGYPYGVTSLINIDFRF
jgi:oligosaccharyltransferase complex subunit gamma